MISIAVTNQKGGVGKTTTAVSIAHGLAITGYRTLLVDLDVQGHAALSLGHKKTPALHAFVIGQKRIADVAVQARKNLLLLASDKQGTEDVYEHFNKIQISRDRALAKLIEADPISKALDVLVFDLGPRLDLIHVLALFSSDLAIIPTKLASLDLDGVNEVLRTVNTLRENGHEIDYFILPTFFNRVEREIRQNLELLAKKFPAKLWPPIPKSTEVEQAPGYGQTVWQYCPTVPAVRGYETKPGKFSGGYAETLGKLQNLIGPPKGGATNG